MVPSFFDTQNEMKHITYTIVGVLGSIIAMLFGGWNTALQTLVIFMVIDWITGGMLYVLNLS